MTALGREYDGHDVDADDATGLIQVLDGGGRYVVKVDQAIKKRMKQGLVKLDRSREDVVQDIAEMTGRGFSHFLVEPYRTHDQADERYLAFEHGRGGTTISYSVQGGIDIEEQAGSIRRVGADEQGFGTAGRELGVPADFIKAVAEAFDAAYGTFLEINPLVAGDEPLLLDVAAEVDAEASHLARKFWTPDDFRTYRRQTPEEVAIAELAAQSRASLRFEMINPDGAVWLLLSGGGASIVVADEVNNRGFGESLGNYGEYSGNPNEAETKAYTHELLSALLHSKAQRKVLVIAGAVANFTDVRVTFQGVIKAIDELADQLREQGVKVFVRRGGPHQSEGLSLMHGCLERNGLLGEVHGPELPLAESVSAALQSLEASA